MSKFLVLLFVASVSALEWMLPLELENRQSWNEVRFTQIGHFGTYRKERPGIPAHLHTAIDLMRLVPDSVEVAIYAIAEGTVISFRDDGPFAQIIIEHVDNGDTLWSVYEHVGGVFVILGEEVGTETKIARYMNNAQLDRYGRHFNHLHLEIMKTAPPTREPHPTQESLKFGTYCLVAYDKALLNKYYYSPEKFFNEKWKKQSGY